MSNTTAPAAPTSRRELLYIKPRKRRLSEYEAVTCYAQRSPDAFDIEGWYTLGPAPDHRTAFRPESTRLVHHHWYDFRDPDQQWQRTYVRMQAEQERAIERVTDDAIRNGALAQMDPAWRQEIIAGHYRLWAFFDNALFRAFAVQSREALADTLGNVLCFQAFDHMRHAQAIILHLLALEETLDGFRDDGDIAKERWLTDPVYQPMRRLVERLMLAVNDWAELPIAVNLVVSPILAEVGLSQLVRRPGSYHGDPVTPFIVTTTERDRRRNIAYTQELVRMVTDEGVQGHSANRDVIRGWIESWSPLAVEAAMALRPVFDRVSVKGPSFDETLSTAIASQVAALETVGLALEGVA